MMSDSQTVLDSRIAGLGKFTGSADQGNYSMSGPCQKEELFKCEQCKILILSSLIQMIDNSSKF